MLKLTASGTYPLVREQAVFIRNAPMLLVEVVEAAPPVEGAPVVVGVEPLVLPLDVEPLVVPLDVEPLVVPLDVEPLVLPLDVEPLVLPLDVEPLTVPVDVEPLLERLLYLIQCGKPNAKADMLEAKRPMASPVEITQRTRPFVLAVPTLDIRPLANCCLISSAAAATIASGRVLVRSMRSSLKFPTYTDLKQSACQ